jgi:hypothetical protein
MNLLVKLSVVPIFFLPLIAGWAGTLEEAKVLEQPSVKTTEPWQITVGGPVGWPGSAATPDFTALTPTSTSESAKFSNISTLFIRSPGKFEEGDLVSWVISYT